MKLGKIALALACLGAWLAPQASAQTPAPVWQLITFPMPTHFLPGKNAEILMVATNIGGAPATGPITFSNTLPAGIKPIEAAPREDDSTAADPTCDPITTQTITCTSAGPIAPGRQLELRIVVEVTAPEGPLTDESSVKGGGAVEVKTTTPLQVSTTPPVFDFLADPPFSAPLTEADGSPATQAGSHPYQLTVNLGFPTESPGSGALVAAGHLRDSFADLPRGLVINPAATPALCTEAELITEGNPGCPLASQIGTVSVITQVATLEAHTSPLFNMVPPPGVPASLGFNAIGIGIFPHLIGSVRSDGDFGLSGGATDILARSLNPVFGARIELWSDPSSPAHDEVRGKCMSQGGTCPTPQTKTALLTMPSDCSGSQLTFKARAKSWEKPNETKEATYQSASLEGAPVTVGGCNELQFKPKIETKPTTNLTDSPSGLEFNLHQPQEMKLGGRSTANLKDTVLTLPEGLVVNPSAAQGQGVCTPAQIGLRTAVGQSPPRFSKDPASCPDSAKVGTLKVSTPLLAQTDETKAKVQYDAEENAIPRVLEGSLYLAEPFQNPFGSLLGIYFDIEDAQSGTVVKLASQIHADPVTGQLRGTLIESPELPLQDAELKFFNGPRASLRTPAACAPYSASAELTPWSAPQADKATATDSFSLTAAPGGGPCPASAPAAPHQPGFSASTITPQAASYSPFLMRLTREDGSQNLSGFEATLPGGLTAKLAGIPYCSEAQIAQAQARSHPNEGALEQASPSCPAASEVGSVDVGAGAGPLPLHTSGRIYLAGPYKGAPLSFAVITPAIAGPFDLGTVVVRAAAYLNPETAIVRAVSDPLPTILEGIPLDVRSAAVKMGRPQFTLNPTSCDPKTASANVTSIFGQTAALTSPFQVGGCRDLGFKPKLDFKLKGPTKRTGFPALTVTGSFKAGQANVERAAVALPASAFLEQAHIGTVCTRVQFAADKCPARSVYGFAKAKTPLLDKPLEGPVYMRSSSHELPDVVAALHGQVDVVLVTRIDSIKGRIRATVENAPDAPVSSFRLEMRGGRKGLLVNSTNLCAKRSYVRVKLDAHNGKTHDFKAPMKNDCSKKSGKGKGKGKSKGR